MAIATGSMAIIASAADSLLDLVSGIVLLVADRMANQNVDFYKYPEGRSRVEPIGIIIFATVMCLSSLNILIECIKRIITGLVGSPLEIEVGVLGFVVLGLTIVIKFALWLWCKFVLGMVGGSASVDAYAQDHMNDVLTNATAVGCVILATQLKGWWIADPLGAAVISLWIIYSWWETGKEHVAHLSGHVAPINFHQRLTFIAANCDDLILKVDTVRAFHFGEKFIVEIHVVLDEQLPLRVAHDVGEKLEVMVEKLEEVDRCFVHMDYEYEHSPEYKRRQPAPTINVNNSPLLSKSSSRSTSGGSTPSTPNGEPSSPR
jgi:cation diffusion facilitator family transporter